MYSRLDFPRRMAILILATFILLVPVSLMRPPFAQAAPVAGRTIIPGHLVPALQHQTPQTRRPAAETRQLQLSLSLTLRNQAALTQLLQEQNDPHSPLYHAYLSPQQFAEQFSPSQTTVNQVISYLTGQGLKVTSVSSNRLLVDASGPQSAVEQAFGVSIADYSYQGRSVYAPTNEPSVPSNLAGMLLDIAGLDDVGLPQRMASLRPMSGPGGGYTPDDLTTAYDVNQLFGSDTGDAGLGQTVAIFELDGYIPSDINTYLNQYNLGSPKYSNVLVDGATNAPGPEAVEVALDMETVSAIASNAKQLIYIGPAPSGSTLTSFIASFNQTSKDIFNRMVTDNLAKVVSTSWGLCETTEGTSQLSALDAIFQQGAAQGISFFAASGDSGAFGCGDNNLTVDSPADDPYVVGVGGTNLQLTCCSGFGNSYVSESAWSDGGGGYSSFFSKPTYQSGSGVDSNSKRHVPDISADADPATGYSIYCTVSAAGCPGWTSIGGTSAAAPLWAGIALDINAFLLQKGKTPLGNVNAELYHLFNTTQPYGSSYHDVTTGNNLFYNAGSGYDLATGMGTPRAWTLAQNVAIASVARDFYSNDASQIFGYDQGNPIFEIIDLGNAPGVAPISSVATRGRDVYEMRGSNTYQVGPDTCVYPGSSNLTGCLHLVDNNPTTVQLAAGGLGQLYLRHSDGSIWQYNGHGLGDWSELDDNPKTVQIFAGGGSLYQEWNDGTVEASTGPCFHCWVQIDAPQVGTQHILTVSETGGPYELRTGLAVGGGSTTSVYYHGSGTNWVLIDPARKTNLVTDLEASGHDIYELQADHSIRLYNFTQSIWVTIDTNPATLQIIAGVNGDLYQVRSDGNILLYTPSSGAWVAI